MTDPAAKRAKRLLWGLVIVIALLNLVLVLVCSRSQKPADRAPSESTAATNQPAAK
jgi:cytochrome c-type biogenesis protein CcmH/NrfF